jgi:hypothetical protein
VVAVVIVVAVAVIVVAVVAATPIRIDCADMLAFI